MILSFQADGHSRTGTARRGRGKDCPLPHARILVMNIPRLLPRQVCLDEPEHFLHNPFSHPPISSPVLIAGPKLLALCPPRTPPRAPQHSPHRGEA
jgi:hypothetical protein